MITEEEYRIYLGVNTTPNNFKRLEYLSVNTLKSIMICNIPNENDLIYESFKKALMEQMNYFELNENLINDSIGGNYTLGSYSESDSSNENSNSKSIVRVSPVAYDILLNCGLLYSGIGECNYG